MFSRFTIFQRGLLIVGMPFIFQLFIASITFYQEQGHEQDERFLLHSKEVISQIFVLQSALVEAEAAVRGYLLTDDGAFIAQYRERANSLPELVQKLRDTVHANVRQAAVMDQLEGDMAEVLDGMGQVAKQGRAAGPTLVTQLLEEKRRMDVMRVTIKTFLDSEQQVQEQRTTILAATRRRLRLILLVAGLLGFFMTLALAKAFSQAIGDRLTELAEAAAAFGNGTSWQLNAAVSHDEIGKLTRSFRSMARRLTEATAKEKAHQETLERQVAERTMTLRQEVAEHAATVAELSKTTADLQRSNRDLQDFAMVASHDLQEPLRKVQTYAKRLHDEWVKDVPAAGVAHLERIVSSVQRMQTLIDDLLTYSRVSSKAQPFARVDLNAVLRGVVADLETAIEASHAQIVASELPHLEADETQMRQLFQNLISNSLKFRRPDAAPVVHVSACLNKPAEADAAMPQVGQWQLQFQDNGIGFEQKYADRIFGIFQRLHGKDKFAGTGIGLAVCRKIVERHGGRIAATSVPNQGTTFIVTLSSSSKIRGESDHETP